MAGDDDRARGRVAARNLGDDIAGCLVADRLRGEQQFHLERTGRALALADELIGIWVGYRSGRDRRHAIGEIGHARVGIAMVVGTDREDADADRAFFGCDARPHEAAAAIEAIAARSEENTSELQSLMR